MIKWIKKVFYKDTTQESLEDKSVRRIIELMGNDYGWSIVKVDCSWRRMNHSNGIRVGFNPNYGIIYHPDMRVPHHLNLLFVQTAEELYKKLVCGKSKNFFSDAIWPEIKKIFPEL